MLVVVEVEFDVIESNGQDKRENAAIHVVFIHPIQCYFIHKSSSGDVNLV
jgi:hypothetical protein